MNKLKLNHKSQIKDLSELSVEYKKPPFKRLSLPSLFPHKLFILNQQRDLTQMPRTRKRSSTYLQTPCWITEGM